MRDFFVCDIFGASLKDDLATMEHPVFSLSTRPDRKIRQYEHNGVEITVTPSVRGRATIHDKDILIYCISQLMAALNAGREIGRTLQLTAHDLLIATRRDTGGDSYTRLREAFERLAGTRITTNLAVGGVETTSGFGLIEAWEIVRKSRGGRMISVTVTLSEWLFRAVMSKSVLTLSRDYFALRKPLERRIYELARKHCGKQREWRVSVGTLHIKAGSDAPVRVFRAAVRKMIAANTLPGYVLTEEPGDIIRVTRAGVVDDGPATATAGAPLFGADTLERVRQIAPGWDAYALEAEWRNFWVESGRPRLAAPEKAYLAWVAGRITRD
ncbi:replication initiator protein A [Flavimaricola marinus]|uniref:Replication initiator protein A n=1 Tax=Flavimaricola marinus TaxID=1819565 RepID=A0A238LHX6_9RHOB|nr:replication initiator protein A [Flavimaricola marinus]SMY09251.1 Replication initiator protein A [Flavimaricola marinus]